MVEQLRIARPGNLGKFLLMGKNLEPVILLLNPGEPRGFARDWQPQGLSPEKHRGYALQWFAFATLLGGLFLVLNLRKP